jgi:nucleoside-diphosphate-sugar epimerase
VILRFGSFFGRAPVTRFDSVANRFAYLAGIGRSLVIHGTGNQKRPLIDVEDAAGSILFALGNWSEVRNKVLNVSLSHFRILEVAKIVETICPGIPIRYTEQDFREHFTFELDSKQIRKYGWEPRVELREGLERVIESFSGMNKFSPEFDLEEES